MKEGGVFTPIRVYKLEEMTNQEKKFLMERAKGNIVEIKDKIKPVLENVQARGDEALLEYTKKFDGFSLEKSQIKITEKEIDTAFENTEPETLKAIEEQIKLSKKFAEMQIKDNDWQREVIPGLNLGQKTTPIDIVGLYVPGGTAPLPTVMQILGVPAKIAGVKRIIACTPPREDMNPMLVAARLSGVDEVYRIGGAQAIAAMAYGTETIPKVRKIVGPGNIYVTAAKELVFGEVSIDMPAGPSEALIIADDSANPVFVAADILARAEHDTNAAGVLVTDNEELAKSVVEEIGKQKTSLPRQKIINGSLQKYSGIVLVKNQKEAVEFANEYAAEHLEILTKNPWETMKGIENAGSIFLGENAPVAVGDYASGVNHVLPTGGNARMFSAVGVETFQKKSEFEFLTKEGLAELKKIVDPIARLEGLEAHRRSVEIRFEGEKNE